MDFNKKTLAIVLVVAAMFMLTAFSGDNNDKMTIFGDVEVKNNETVRGDCAAIFGNVRIDGTVEGNVAAIFGNVTLSGKVDGDVVSVFGKLKLNENAVIKGDTAAIGGGIERAAGSELQGEVADVSIPFVLGQVDWIPNITTGSLFGLAVLYGLSCLVYLLIPERVVNISKTIWDRMPRRFGIGLLAFLAFIPGIIVLAITLIGILAIPFFILGFILVAFIASVAMYIALGRRTTGNLPEQNSVYIYLVVGVVIMFALKFIPVFGWLANMALACIALGAAIDTRLGGGRTVRPQTVWEGNCESIRPVDTPKKSDE